MSELLVNTIKKADGTGSLTVPAESGTVVTTASPSLGRRNLIINGAMQVAQRGTSATAQQAGSFQYYTVDRFLTYFYGAGVATQEQVSDAPTDFSYSTKFTVTTPDSSIGAADDYIFGQRLEGYNSAQLNLGTANAKTFTISFWL